MRNNKLFTTVFVCLALAACSEAAPTAFGTASAPIYDGTLDDPEMFPAAVALIQLDKNDTPVKTCSGVIVSVKGDSAVVLTAAHCAVELDAKGNIKVPAKALPASQMAIFTGTDYLKPTGVHIATELAVHGSYNPISGFYDFAVVRFEKAPPGTPSVPPLTAAEDTLEVGAVLDVVGYGQTKSGTQGKRYRLQDTIAGDEQETELRFSQAEGGVCQGDSGGPSFTMVNGQLRVAGITSSISSQCGTGSWYAGRVSVVAKSFVQPFIDGKAAQVTCGECRDATVSQGGTCHGKVQDCFDNTACAGLASCLNSCSTDACIDQCSSKHPGGVPLYLEVSSCGCDACSVECAGDAACQGPAACGLEFAIGACDACVDQTCCAEEQACADDIECLQCVSADPAPAGCATNAKVAAYQHCYSVTCAAPCDYQHGKCGPALGDPACAACVESACCTQASACASDASCYQCALGASAGPACDANPLFVDYRSCSTQACGDTCGVGGQGGAAGAGGSGQGGGEAGTGGAGGSGQAGSEAGGEAGQGGDSVSGGSGQGGTASGASGEAAASGVVTAGSSAAGPTGGEPDTSGGCGVAGRPGQGWGVLAALGLLAARRQRREVPRGQ